MKKALIVEDDQIVRNIYSNKLSLEGFYVESAPDVKKGWEVLQSMRPDVVLLDLVLPGAQGTELLRMMRASNDFRSVPVVVLSNTYLSSMIQDAWKAGATRCLAKANCTPRQVIDVISGCLAGAPSAAQAFQPAPAPVMPTPAPQLDPAASAQPQFQPAPAQAQVATPPMPRSDKSEFEQQQELRANFIASLPGTIRKLRSQLQNAAKTSDTASRLDHLNQMQEALGTLNSASSVSGLMAFANMVAATHALVRELHERPRNFNASTLRTMASALDFMSTMVSRGHLPQWEMVPSPNILVVDDEPISRKAVVRALAKAHLKAISVSKPSVAISLLEENSFDLVFLDIDMPEMNGFELCANLRKLPGHAKTPVVFVTGLSDFDSRANSMISGGTDLIAKPFLPIELAVKALRYILSSHVGSQPKTADNITQPAN